MTFEVYLLTPIGVSIGDLDIAKKDNILDVKFNYAYTALIKGGINLFSQNKNVF